MAEAIQKVISEFKTISPDLSQAVVFRPNGQTIAASESSNAEQTSALATQLSTITSAQCIGGVQRFVIQDASEQLAVNAVGDVYFAAVSRRTGAEHVVQSLTQVIAPTVIRLALGCKETPPKVELPAADAKPVKFAPVLSEPLLTKTPVCQLMVEKLSGLLVASDTVRISSETLEKWRETFSKPFSQVKIETLDGKTVTCKVKPQKDAKSGGFVLVPEKLLLALGSEVGTLVIVKPTVEEESQ